MFVFTAIQGEVFHSDLFLIKLRPAFSLFQEHSAQPAHLAACRAAAWAAAIFWAEWA